MLNKKLIVDGNSLGLEEKVKLDYVVIHYNYFPERGRFITEKIDVADEVSTGLSYTGKVTSRFFGTILRQHLQEAK